MENKDFSKKKTRIIMLVGVLFCLVIAATVFIQQYPKMKDFGISGIFEEEAVKAKTTEIIELFTAGEYQKILDGYANAGLKEDATAEDFAYAAAGLGTQLGELQKIDSISLGEMEKGGIIYAVSESRVIYENITVKFTFSFNKDMEFSGIYMQEETEE